MKITDIHIGKNISYMTMASLGGMMTSTVSAYLLVMSFMPKARDVESLLYGSAIVGAMSLALWVTHFRSGRRKATLIRLTPTRPSQPANIYGLVRFLDGTEKEALLGSTLTLREEFKSIFSNTETPTGKRI